MIGIASNSEAYRCWCFSVAERLSYVAESLRDSVLFLDRKSLIDSLPRFGKRSVLPTRELNQHLQRPIALADEHFEGFLNS